MSIVDSYHWRIEEWFPTLSKEVLQSLKRFHSELIYFNGKMNLISKPTVQIADQVHFADCIMGSEIVLRNSSSSEIYDIGSGNGLPGLILALLSQERQVRLIERSEKKVEFLKICVSRLGLKNVEVKQCLFEDLPSSSLKCGISRGFASMIDTISHLEKLSPMGGKYYHFKSQKWLFEMESIPDSLKRVWVSKSIGEYSLPNDGPRRVIVLTKKSRQPS